MINRIYNVVFEETTGAYTWSSFESEEDFKIYRNSHKFRKPVEKGIGVEDLEASRICGEHNNGKSLKTIL